MKFVLIFFAFIIAAALLVVGINFYLTPKDDLAKADYIVAISGGDTKSRTLQAIDLYKQGYAQKLVFSGAALDPLSPSNAKVMHDLAVENGVPESDIIVEELAKKYRTKCQEDSGQIGVTIQVR